MESKISVRQFCSDDKQAVRDICIETSSFPMEQKGMREFIILMYNDYYTEIEPENCFVAVGGDGNVLGYLLCAQDFDRYYRIFRTLYLPEIRKLGIKYYIMAMSEIYTHKAFSKKYPAHLHIDLTAACRRKGVGTMLMNELKRRLKEKNTNALMLSCGASNTAAVKFYEKNNFKTVCLTPGGKIMACKF